MFGRWRSLDLQSNGWRRWPASVGLVGFRPIEVFRPRATVKGWAAATRPYLQRLRELSGQRWLQRPEPAPTGAPGGGYGRDVESDCGEECCDHQPAPNPQPIGQQRRLAGTGLEGTRGWRRAPAAALGFQGQFSQTTYRHFTAAVATLEAGTPEKRG